MQPELTELITSSVPVSDAFTLEVIKQNIMLYLPRLVTSILVLVIGFKIQPLFIGQIQRFFARVDYDRSLEKFLESLFGIAYKVTIILFAVSIAGIETASIVAAVGAAGFAVGLALQGSMSNFASGILILTLKPIKVGEYIELDPNTSGTVNKIDIFNTVLLTPDNKTIIIPNSEITSKVLINYSREKQRRIDLEIGVAYNTDISKAKKVLEKTIAKHSELIIENEKRSTIIGVAQLAESSVNISLFVWCNSDDYWTLRRALLEDIKIALDKAGIEIPFPTVTLKK